MHKPSILHKVRKGAAFVEYVVLMGLLSVVVIFTVFQLGAGISDAFGTSNDIVAERIDEATNPPGSGGTGPNPFDPWAPNVPGTGAPVSGVVAFLDLHSEMTPNMDFRPYCVQLESDILDGNQDIADVWCIGDGDTATTAMERPSNLEWRMNTSTGAPIWHNQLCLYNTATGSFVTNIHSFWSEQTGGFESGLPEYNGTWLKCQQQNNPTVLATSSYDGYYLADYDNDVIWTPAAANNTFSHTGNGRALPPSGWHFIPVPAWSTHGLGEMSGSGYYTQCVYSDELMRHITTYASYDSNGILKGSMRCQGWTPF